MAKKLTQEEFIERAKKKHGDKYDYSKVNYINSQTEVCLICHEKDEFGEEHGEFYLKPNTHLNGTGCSKCSGLKKWNTEYFIKKAKKEHGDKYDYSKTNYINKRTDVIITCPIHGDFKQNPHNHISQKQGCPECGKIKAKERIGNFKNSRKTAEQFKQELSKMFNGYYELIGEYINNKTKTEFYCHNKNNDGKEHGTFFIKPNDLICGHGCKKCVHSLLEEKMEIFLQENNIKYETEKMFKEWLGNQKLDFYLPEYNIAIECQGGQHYKPVDFAGLGKEWAENNFKKIKRLDENKFKLCLEHNVNILYFTEENIKKDKKTFFDLNELLKKIKEYDKN